MSKVIKRSIPFLIGTVIFVLLASSRDALSVTDAAERYLILCDAAFVPGAMLGCFALLIFVAAGGVFDMISFGVKKIIRSFRREEGVRETYADYIAMQRAKGKPQLGHYYLSALLFLALAVVFLILYNKAV